MTETAGDKPFPGFPGFPPAEMLDKMWGMMRLTPFGSAFPGMQPGTAQGFGSPLSAMSDMMAPLMNVEELDKRITDMRAVEQWLKLNLNMLQSAIQALEVQRATLATLSAFGAFAQASMAQPTQNEASQWAASPWGASSEAAAESGATDRESAPAAASGDEAGNAQQSAQAAFDPSIWWNMLQSQFNQLASFAAAQPGAAQAEAPGGAERASDADADADAPSTATAAKRAAKRSVPRKASGKAPGGGTASRRSSGSSEK